MKHRSTELVLAVMLSLPMAATAAAADAPQVAAAKPTAVANVKPVAIDAQRVIPLQGAWNVRTFAGLQGRHGPIPADAFVRTADLGRLTDADRDALAAAGVKLDIDLRTADEEAQSPDLLARDDRFAYQRISLMGTEKMDLQKMMTSFPDSLGEAYVQWLGHSQPQFKQVFQRIAAQQDGAVLFHCTAGKDRTGIIAGLLLDLAGVPKAEIVHNYAISAHYLEGQPKDSAMNAQIMALVKQNPEIARKMAGMSGTAPDNMEQFLAALHSQYGGAEGYLKSIGVSEQEIQQLKVRLGQAGIATARYGLALPVGLYPGNPYTVLVHVVAFDARGLRATHLADLLVRARDRLRLHLGFVFEGMRFVGVAVIAVQRPVQRSCAGWTCRQQPEAAIVAHEVAIRMRIASASMTVPAVSAASSIFHCCTGTLPMVSPVRPFTAM